MGIAREIFLRASHSEWLAEQLGRRTFTRRAVRRFMPGERLEDALAAASTLRRRGDIAAILTLLGENVLQAEEAETVRRHYLDVLNAVNESQLEADISVKPTQLGIDLDIDSTHSRLSSLARRAAELGRRVAIDMEDSSYVDPTLDLYRRSLEQGNVTICLQSYLYRTDDDLEALLPLLPSIRLVKGAYKEPDDVARRRKSEVDASFLRHADLLLQAQRRDDRIGVFFGTHDPEMIEGVCQRAEELGLPKRSFEFQMLYGIRGDLQSRLSAEGYRVRVLISYGSSWFPWYMRRLAERPANALFVLKNLFTN